MGLFWSGGSNQLNQLFLNKKHSNPLASKLSLFQQISQISCFDSNKAPQGCTQYFTGVSGQLNSYNNINLYQLANQLQTICIR